jgi:hypothetical protein
MIFSCCGAPLMPVGFSLRSFRKSPINRRLKVSWILENNDNPYLAVVDI